MDKSAAAPSSSSPAEVQLAQIGLMSAYIQLTLLAIYGIGTQDLLSGSSLTFTFFFFGLLIANLIRVFLCVRQPELVSRFSRGGWAWAYRVVSFYCGLGWGACQFVVIRLTGASSSDASVGYALIVGLCAWCSLSLAHAPKSCRIVITLMILPVVVALVEFPSRASLSIAFALSLYFAFLQYLVGFQQSSIGLALARLKQLEAISENAKMEMVAGLDSVPGIAWILRTDGTPKFFNRKGREYLGLSADEFGFGWTESIHPDDLATSILAWETAVAIGGTCETSFRLKRASDGEYRWHLAVTSPVRNAQGEIESWAGTCLDIEESKRSSLEKAEALYRERSAIESDRLKSEFLANMSHEIRTPLNGILGSAEFLSDEALSENQKKYTRLLQQSTKNLLAIVNDILDFSKIEARKIELEKLNFSIAEILHLQANLFAKSALDKQIHLDVQIDPSLPLNVIGDAGRIGQVVLNLLTNAIKFTHEGSIRVTARSEARTGERVRIRFSVSDTGIGLSEDAKAKLFKPFMQADSSTARKFGGTGLGLSISKGLIGLMDGQMGVESQVGVGSEFWFSLELDIAESARPDARIAEMSPMKGLGERRWKILIAEDNSTNQILAVANLNRLGIASQVAANGLEVLAALQASEFDLILMDCHMPEMDGFEAAKKIREMEATTGRRIPIIALTASARKEDEMQCRAAGMDDFLTKPLQREKLNLALQKWLVEKLPSLAA